MLVLGLAYLVASAAGFAAAAALGTDHHPLARVAIADGVGTAVIFGFSFALKNSSVYDPYWSVAPILIAVALAWLLPDAPPQMARTLLVVGLTAAWGLRLTYSFLRGWPGLHHEDWRYGRIARETGRAYWLVSFLGIHLLPTLFVFGGCVALFVACAGAAPLGPLDLVAAIITAGAIAIETLADKQLHTFVKTNRRPGAILGTGLWAYSRHPNYFGEVMFWLGLGLFGLAAAPGAWWVLGGATMMLALFVFISIPLIERRHRARRPGYADHARRVSMFIPWPPRAG